jgi:dCMP deaminase
VHAEANAIFNAARRGIQTKGAKIYTTKFPCASCAGAIVQAGIRAVITRDTEIWKKDPTGDDGRRSLRILIEAGVAVHAPEIEIGELPKVIEARTNGFPRKTKRAKQG